MWLIYHIRVLQIKMFILCWQVSVVLVSSLCRLQHSLKDFKDFFFYKLVLLEHGLQWLTARRPELKWQLNTVKLKRLWKFIWCQHQVFVSWYSECQMPVAAKDQRISENLIYWHVKVVWSVYTFMHRWPTTLKPPV